MWTHTVHKKRSEAKQRKEKRPQKVGIEIEIPYVNQHHLELGHKTVHSDVDIQSDLLICIFSIHWIEKNRSTLGAAVQEVLSNYKKNFSGLKAVLNDFYGMKIFTSFMLFCCSFFNFFFCLKHCRFLTSIVSSYFCHRLMK